MNHDESLKFNLKQKAANWDRYDPIFKTEQLRDGKLTQINLKKDLEKNRSIWRPMNELHWLYGRNKQIH